MYKVLHVFSDSPYTYKFIKFTKENFDECSHHFIIFSFNDTSKFLKFYYSQNNCSVTKSKNIYINYKNKFKDTDKIIIHQLNKPILMLSLSVFYNKAFEKMTWSIWGGDVYFYKYKTNSLKDSVLEVLRKIHISKIPIITAYIKGDYDQVIKTYKSNAKYIKSKYPSPINIDLIKAVPLKINNDTCVNILVGNSADKSNEHIETFKLIEKYKNENIKIFSVLSYGGTEEYKDKVVSVGKNLFNNKFIPIFNYMNFNDYLSFINNCDVCIFNHKRQQSLGNQMVFFALEKKVYISDTTTPFCYYKNLGIKIDSTESIVNMNFKNFINNEKDVKENNRKIILKDISEEVIKNEWKEVFG